MNKVRDKFKMGKIFSLALKPLKEFNIESRAHKIISREKPVPAPKYKADVLELERIQREHPEIIEQQAKKDEMLDKRLRKVFVDSFDPPELEKPPSSINRPLPTLRSTPGDFEYGFHEPKQVPLGRVTLKNALQFINNYQLDPKSYTSTKIALQHSLPEETVKNILKYCKIFEIYLPKDDKKVKTTFLGRYVPRKEIVVRRNSKAALAEKTDKNEKGE